MEEATGSSKQPSYVMKDRGIDREKKEFTADPIDAYENRIYLGEARR